MNPGNAGRRILIVDDHSVNRRIPAALLQKRGWLVELAADGESALEMLKQAHFDAVLLDINMPVTSGFEVCRRLRADESQKHLRIIACTAMRSIDVLPPGVGFDAMLRKPYTPDELIATVEGDSDQSP